MLLILGNDALYLEITGPQHVRKLHQSRERKLDLLNSGRCLQGSCKPLIVRHGIIQGRYIHLQINDTDVIAQGQISLCQMLHTIVKNLDLLRGA